MQLTRNSDETILERLQSDPAYAQAFLEEFRSNLKRAEESERSLAKEQSITRAWLPHELVSFLRSLPTDHEND